MKNRWYSRLMVTLLAALCAFAGMTAFAAEPLPLPDLSQTGSIRITMKNNGTTIPGGDLTLYHVGEIRSGENGYYHTPTEEFTPSGLALRDLSEKELPARFLQYAEHKRLSGITKGIRMDGTVRFEDLKPGVYLLAQTIAPKGYHPLAPFFVTVPYRSGDHWEFNVDASPKAQPDPLPKPPPPPDHILPDTGQLNWPVPVLAALGLILFVTGWCLNNGKGKRTDEK